MEEIKLSGPEFKALASETRTEIIKLLKDRNHTLTEISKKLKLAAPTIKQHLGILENADLIQELDEGRKWKYYCLTRKGKNIFLHETPINVFIVLGASIVALVGLLYSFISMVEGQAMSFVNEGGQAFIAPTLPRVASGAPILASAAADATKETACEATVETVGCSIPEAVAASAAAPFSFEMVVMLFGIVAIAVLAGYLVAKTRN